MYHIDFRKIKEELDIRQVARDNGIKLNRRGYTCCPFHSEKTPSMRIEKEFFYCYGCNTGGDIFDFVEKLNGTNLMGAVDYLNRSYRLGLGDTRQDRQEIREEQQLRRAERVCREHRKHELKQIAEKYTDELRILNGLSEDETVKRRAEVLNTVLDEYACGNWDTLVMFAEQDEYKKGDYLEKHGYST